MKKTSLSLILLFAIMSSSSLFAQVPVKPEHVIFVLEENYSYNEIIGSALAPTFTWLSTTPYTANFTDATAITHPSEPNYLDLFSGENQGVAVDWSGQYPTAPFNDCNLGSSLIQHGYTFAGYSEGQPSVGWYAGDNTATYYWTKHCPWINWMPYNGVNNDTIPLADDIPYSYITGLYTSGPIFPDSNHYSTLPTVTWVIPNSIDDMHDNSESVAIPAGDNWFKKNMMPLVRWATNPVNKSIVITIWDENDGTAGNQIPLLVSGAMIKGGNYSTAINHYSVLKTVEDMYGLTECGNSASAVDFPSTMWIIDAGVNSIDKNTNKMTAWPIPANNELNVKITSAADDNATVGIYDITGRLVKQTTTVLKSGDNTIVFNTGDVVNGIYLLTVKGEQINICNKITVAK
jgi:hypothetical protein